MLEYLWLYLFLVEVHKIKNRVRSDGKAVTQFKFEICTFTMQFCKFTHVKLSHSVLVLRRHTVLLASVTGGGVRSRQQRANLLLWMGTGTRRLK